MSPKKWLPFIISCNETIFNIVMKMWYISPCSGTPWEPHMFLLRNWPNLSSPTSPKCSARNHPKVGVASSQSVAAGHRWPPQGTQMATGQRDALDTKCLQEPTENNVGLGWAPNFGPNWASSLFRLIWLYPYFFLWSKLIIPSPSPKNSLKNLELELIWNDHGPFPPAAASHTASPTSTFGEVATIFADFCTLSLLFLSCYTLWGWATLIRNGSADQLHWQPVLQKDSEVVLVVSSNDQLTSNNPKCMYIYIYTHILI